MAAATRVCVIGAGSSGIASCQVLKSRGIPFDCFEKGSDIGGIWCYGNDNGMSGAYRSLHINTHRDINAFESFPAWEELSDFPHHTEMKQYFDAFVDRFGLREHIRFSTAVTDVEPDGEGAWRVTTEDGETRTYSDVLIANGHHWNPRMPEFPGEFHGDQIHSHDYRGFGEYADKNVLVVGFGNSSVDIAVETSRVSNMTFLSVRRGAWVVPKFLGDKPLTKPDPMFDRLPWKVQLFLYRRLVKKATGSPESYGLPMPDHKLGEAHPTISHELLNRIGHGRIKPKPNVERLEGDCVRFVDGSVERIDKIVYGTGYRITFPFLSRDLVDPVDNQLPLYRRVVHPELPGLWFIGLVQPLGSLPPLAEAQAEYAADAIEGKIGLPTREHMEREMERAQEKIRKRYVASPRHTIQVDFQPYKKELLRERKRARKWAGQRPAAPAARERERVASPA